MNGHERLKNQVLLVYGAGLAIGMHLGMLNLMMSRRPSSALYVFAASMVNSTVVLALWQWVLPRFNSHSFLRRTASQAVVTVLCFAVVMVLAVELHGVLFDAPSILRTYDGGPVTVTISELTIQRAPYLYALIPVLPIAVLCLVGFNQHWWRMLVLEGRQEELRELAASAQLAALRAQINPHFLFNSLNTIAQLISVDPAKAELCVERLAEIFRYMLTRGEAQFVPLADELNIVEAYLEIERARFGDELVFEERIDEQARRVLLPGLILQPLVENAVKHGVSRKIGGGRVTIEARLEQGDLRLAVRDTGVGVREGAAVFEDGVGLRNVRDRLMRLYGDDYSPEVTSRPGYGTTVSLRIPVAHGSA